MSYFTTTTEVFTLSPRAVTLLTFLQKKANNKTRSSFWRKSKIAGECNMSLSTFARALRELKEKALVYVNERYEFCGRQRSNEYILLDKSQNGSQDSVSSAFCVESKLIPKVEESGLAELPKAECAQIASVPVNLHGNMLKVYLYLLERCGKKGYAVSKRSITKSCQISMATVSRCLKGLALRGYIAVRSQTRSHLFGNNGQGFNLYSVRSARMLLLHRLILSYLISMLTPSPISPVAPLWTIPTDNFKSKERKTIYAKVTKWYQDHLKPKIQKIAIKTKPFFTLQI